MSDLLWMSKSSSGFQFIGFPSEWGDKELYQYRNYVR